MGLARITAAVIQNQDVALPVSAYLQGEYGVEDLYIGTAAIINRSGIVLGYIWNILINGVLSNVGQQLLALNSTAGFWGMIM